MSTTLSTQQRADLLKHVPALAALPSSTLGALADLVEQEEFQPGTTITVAGQPGDRLYAIVAGQAQATYTDENGRPQAETLGPGNVFGLSGLEPGHQYVTTVIATTALSVLTMTVAEFEQFAATHPRSGNIVRATVQPPSGHKLAHVSSLYRLHFRDSRRERQFLASVAFAVTFGSVRVITHDIRAGRGPFRNVSHGHTHIHHLVWGILALLGVGYLWLSEIGTGTDSARRGMRGTASLYGSGAALTLDEFALWLNLSDVYWARQGRESIDAVILFGSLLSIGLWGGPFFRGLYRFFIPHHPTRGQR